MVILSLQHNPSTMKELRFFLIASAVVLFSCQSLAQPTWDAGEGTTLYELDLVTGVNLPWEILWGPDDHIWATLRSGQVIRINPETGSYTEILDIEVTDDGDGEPGLLGMAMHPDWDNTPQVYLVYNEGPWWNASETLAVYDWNGSELVNPDVLLEMDAGGIHNGSRLLVTMDDKLLMTTGDIGSSSNSQNLNNNMGKVLRLNLDGSIPDDNPTPGSYIYSFGHRNAQGICYGPNGTIFSSEHGQNQDDELNIIEPDRNYGWPTVQGMCNTSNENTFCDENNVKEPIYTWSPCVAVNGIEYYDHPGIPEWQNSLLLAVLGGLGGQYERLSVMHLNAEGTAVDEEEEFFSSFNQRIRDICINPNTGSVYVAFNGPSYPGSGPNTIKEFTPVQPTGIAESSSKAFMNIFPNPASNNSRIEFSDSLIGSLMTIFDQQGKEVGNWTIQTNSMAIGTLNLSAGQYYVRAVAHGQTFSKSLIIK